MYPRRVMGEFETVRRLLEGRSIARFGDGELKILGGSGYVREDANGALTSEMRGVVRSPAPDCLLGIPTFDQSGPKYTNWLRHETRFCQFFDDADGRTYGSAFITRPDSAADNLESAEYFDLISRLWVGRDRVVVVSEPTSKLLACVKAMNPGTVHIECPRREAYAVIGDLEKAVRRAKPDIALLSCGVTATCLANRLAGRGIQAIDLGSVGGLLLRWMPRKDKAQ